MFTIDIFGSEHRTYEAKNLHYCHSALSYFVVVVAMATATFSRGANKLFGAFFTEIFIFHAPDQILFDGTAFTLMLQVAGVIHTLWLLGDWGRKINWSLHVT